MDVIGHIVLDELEAGAAEMVGDVVQAARDQVVEHEHFVPFAQEAVGEMGAEESGPACDEDSHGRSIAAWMVGSNVPPWGSAAQPKPSIPLTVSGCRNTIRAMNAGSA